MFQAYVRPKAICIPEEKQKQKKSGEKERKTHSPLQKKNREKVVRRSVKRTHPFKKFEKKVEKERKTYSTK